MMNILKLALIASLTLAAACAHGRAAAVRGSAGPAAPSAPVGGVGAVPVQVPDGRAEVRAAAKARAGTGDDFIEVDDGHWFKKSWHMLLVIALIGAAMGVL